MACGLTASTITSTPWIASALSAKVSMPCSVLTRARVSAPGSLARIWEASRPLARRPPIRLAAMLPAPIKAIRVLLMSGPCSEVCQSWLAMHLMRAASAKQGRTDTDPGGALSDGRLKVVAHAHGQCVERQIETGLQALNGSESGILGSAIFSRLRDRHQASQFNVRQSTDGTGQGRQIGRSAAGFAGLTADVDLNADVQRGQIGGTLFGQTLCDFQTVHGVHPVEVLGDSASLVRLNGADEVPDQGQVGQFELFAQCFLQVVLAEIAQPGGIRFAHSLGGLGLAHGQQLNAVLVTLGGECCAVYARTNPCDVVCYRGHQEAPAV